MAVGLIGLLVLVASACARGGAGFDYYLLSLSWSPEYCAHSQRGGDEPQCRRAFGFVAHGLWPQNEHGYPHDCPSGGWVSEATIDRMLPIMPSRGLVIHEWRTHGACSGLPADAYFDQVGQAFGSIRIPAAYQSPRLPLQVSRLAVKRAFVDANPGLAAEDLALECGGGELREVRVCLTRQLKPRACGGDVRDRCDGDDEVLIRPLR